MKSFLKHLLFTGLSLAALVPTVRAGVIASEGFDYPAQADNTPLGGSFTGGTGLGGSWQGAGSYRATGLTFSDLKVSGGCVGTSGTQIYYRPLVVSKTGTIWGSYLFNSVGAVDATTTLLSYVVSKQANSGDYNSNTCFGVTPKRYQGTGGDIRIGGNTPTPNTLSNEGGTAVTQGVTYLVLFKVEGLIAPGAAATSQKVTSWILSSDQYDNFKIGDLTEAELNAAAQGSGATAVMQRTTLTATQTATFSATDFLAVQSNNAGDYLNDEFRFSDTSLAEVAPVAAPAANIVSFGPGATVGPVVAGAAAISWTVPFGTNVANLAATYTYSAGSNCPLVSGSSQNFTNPVHYILTSSDGLVTTDYTVTVTVAPASSAKAILVADFGALGPATIVGNTVTLFVSPSQAVTNLTPTFTLSPFATINPTSGVAQNFTSPQIYTVTAQNGTTQSYTVSVQSYGSWSKVASFFILTTPDGANITTGPPEVNFPVLLRLTSNNFNFNEAQTDGRDIRFTTASGFPLSYQIEQWDATGGSAAVWIKVPSISANARQEVRMYWGKSNVTTESSGLKVFNTGNGYCSVLHLNGNVTDATGAISPVNSGATASSGVIGSTAMNLGESGTITASNITNFPSGSNPTSSGEVWIRPRQISSGWAMPLAWGRATEYGWNTWGMHIGFWTSPKVLPAGINCMGPSRTSGSTALQSNRWYHITYSTQNGAGKVYVNGLLDGTSSGGVLNLISPQSMSMSSVGGDIDVDEARISNVERSANWAKLSYENQKLQQSLVGMFVQPGNTFAVAPTSVSFLEGTSTTLSGQAGGALSVKWIEKRNGVDTELATNQFTLPVSAGRTTGTSSYIIQFRASYATGPDQTLDIPVTIVEDLADPQFTLTGPSTWDGRQAITVAPNISNLANLQAKGIANLIYTWSVDGVAVTKTVTTGTPTVPAAMLLTRSQGSGPLTIKLVLNNGGALTTATKTITVTEPATDLFVLRTPGPNEIPVTGQFYARDNSGAGKLYYNGTQGGSPNEVFLKIYTTGSGPDVLYSELRQPLVGTTYAFTTPIAPGKAIYKAVYGTKSTGGVDTVVNTVTNLICGDAYLIEGQSNALSTDNLIPIDPADPWIRTYSNNGTWMNAVSRGGDAPIGIWGFIFAKRLLADYNMPICIINGAAGGTRIDQHRPNPANHTVGDGTYNIYANLLNRVTGAKLTHGIRALLWHQGEADQGTGGIDGDYNYKFYQQYFTEISAAWKQDFPNLTNYYLFQIWPATCGESFPTNNLLREEQRNLSQRYAKMRLMSTVGFEPTGCHFNLTGYQQFSDRISPLVKQDFYAFEPASIFTAPNLSKAYFTTAAKNEVTLVFDQEMALWNPGIPNLIFLDDVVGKVASGSVTGNVMKLQLNEASIAKKITYLKGEVNWNQANLILGKNLIAALTFADVAIGPATAGSAYGTWASNSAQGLTAGINDSAMSDPDRDGMTNLMEFALGSMPMISSPAMLPQLVKSGGSWIYQYSRNDASVTPATNQVVEYGSDLMGWTAVTVPLTTAGIFTITDGSPSDTVKVAIPAGGNSMFIRLKVVQP